MIKNWVLSMRIKYVIICVAMLFHAGAVSANQPLELNLTYHHAEEILQVDVIHVSHDLQDVYIRKILVYKNTVKQKTVYLNRQKNHREASATISIKADVGDVVEVKVFCSNGGVLKESIVVPEVQDEGKEDEFYEK